MNDLLPVLLDLEASLKAADLRDVAFYRDYLAPEALVVSPWGILDRGGASPRPRREPKRIPEYCIADPKVVPLGEGAPSSSTPVSFGEQRLFVSSVYVQDRGRWKAAFHQRTPAL